MNAFLLHIFSILILIFQVQQGPAPNFKADVDTQDSFSLLEIVHKQSDQQTVSSNRLVDIVLDSR